MPKIKSLIGTIVLLLCVLGCILYATADTQNGIEELECIALFDFVTAFIAPNCPIEAAAADEEKISRAIDILSLHGFANETTFENVSISFCPLEQGLGMVRQPNTILLDDGLRLGSNETLAEVIAHEMEHVYQIRDMGDNKFKCAYLNELIACGGCIDKNHPLEAPAYAVQKKVRDFLLERWLAK